jgi:hypothetical protein
MPPHQRLERRLVLLPDVQVQEATVARKSGTQGLTSLFVEAVYRGRTAVRLLVAL